MVWHTYLYSIILGYKMQQKYIAIRIRILPINWNMYAKFKGQILCLFFELSESGTLLPIFKIS